MIPGAMLIFVIMFFSEPISYEAAMPPHNIFPGLLISVSLVPAYAVILSVFISNEKRLGRASLIFASAACALIKYVFVSKGIASGNALISDLYVFPAVLNSALIVLYIILVRDVIIGEVAGWYDDILYHLTYPKRKADAHLAQQQQNKLRRMAEQRAIIDAKNSETLRVETEAEQRRLSIEAANRQREINLEMAKAKTLQEENEKRRLDMQQAKSEATAKRRDAARQRRRERSERIEAEKRKPQEEEARIKAAEEAYQNSPEGRQVRAAKELAEIEKQKLKEAADIDIEKELEIAKIKVKTGDDSKAIVDDIYERMKNL